VLQEQKGLTLGGLGLLAQLSLLTGLQIIFKGSGIIQADALGFARSSKPQAPGCLAIDQHRLQLARDRATGQDDIGGVANRGDGGGGCFSHRIIIFWVID